MPLVLPVVLIFSVTPSPSKISKILPTAMTSLPAFFSRSSMVARGGFRLRSWRLVVR